MLECFQSLDVVRSSNVPTLLAYDSEKGSLVIGDDAKAIAARHLPVAQNFKLAIGDSDAMFEGRFAASSNAKPQRRWEVRFSGSDAERSLSTREITKAFLEQLFANLKTLPEQLIVGIPASKDRIWLSQYRTHLGGVLAEMGFADTQFFPEPFAVFQYYRHVEGLLPQSNQAMAVLVVDFGGGTMDSCIIETTAEGNLSRGGTTALPLGIQSCVGAGKEIDKRLLKCAIAKVADAQLRHESVEARLQNRPWVLLAVEEMKIALASKMQAARLDEDCSLSTETFILPVGSYHPDKAVRLELSGEDLKRVTTDLWRDKQGPGSAIVATISEAKHRKGSVYLQHLDKIIVAGGSSRLPFLRELLIKSISGQIDFKPEDVLLGSTSEKAVALGIAVEAAQDRAKTKRTHHAIGPCVFNELFFITAPRRRDEPILPRIRRRSGGRPAEHPAGTLLSGAMEVSDFTLEYMVDLPFRPHGSLLYWFCEKADVESPDENRLNVGQDVLHLPPKTTTSFVLRISFDPERGMISPEFVFGDQTVAGTPFHFGRLKLRKEINAYTGLDFGTSNSYAVTLWAAPKQLETLYPAFTISPTAGERLRRAEQAIVEARGSGVLNAQSAKDFSRQEQASFVFHSIKIEGSSLSRGETESILDGSTPVLSKEMIEPINVKDAYDFCMENTDRLATTPELFIREIHKIVLRDISVEGGNYRKEPVSLSGMSYSPPDWVEVEPFMTQLASELRNLDPQKSVLQHAAEIHSKITSIHPFSDGNGRTARLVMNAILIEARLPAIVIAYSDKQRYLDALSTSNKGDISELCILFAECLESSLEQLAGNLGTEDDEIEIQAVADPVLSTWIPSEQLAQLMRERIGRAPVDRKNRYDAWLAAFDSLREDFRLTCQGFNNLYGEYLYHVELTAYDKLPYEKYEELLRLKPVPKSWLMGLEVGSDIHSERFVFWFSHISAIFQECCSTFDPRLRIPPKEVSLSVSRRVDGSFQPLGEEPIGLREIAYASGQWLAMIRGGNRALRVEKMSAVTAAEVFLQDSIRAYL